MVYNFNHIASLNSFRPLCKDDPEDYFFHNITHLQVKVYFIHLCLGPKKGQETYVYIYTNAGW
jgi:hypothetical protein